MPGVVWIYPTPQRVISWPSRGVGKYDQWFVCPKLYGLFWYKVNLIYQSWFKCIVLPLERLPKLSWRTQSARLMTYTWGGEDQIDLNLPQEQGHKVKPNRPRPAFEPESLSPFPMTIAFTLCAPGVVCHGLKCILHLKPKQCLKVLINCPGYHLCIEKSQFKVLG